MKSGAKTGTRARAQPADPYTKVVIVSCRPQMAAGNIQTLFATYILRGERPIGVMSRAKYGAAGALAVWCAVVGYFMLLNRTLDLQVYFVLALIGLLVVAVLIDTPFAQPKYMRRMKYIIAAGVAVFGYIVVMKVMEIVAK